MIQEEREWSKICDLGALQLFSGYLLKIYIFFCKMRQ